MKKTFSHIISHHPKLITSVFFTLLASTYALSFAAPIAPGTTLDPTCAPGAVDCFVQIIPSQTGNTNKYLTTNGTSTSWSPQTLVLGGNFTTSGANPITFTTTGTTTLTLPTSGTLATTANLSQFAATTSAQLAGVVSDETGTGLAVFATSPTLTTPNIGAATGTSLNLSSGTITSGLINGQTISSAANFTGSVTGGAANFTTGNFSGNVVIGNATTNATATLYGDNGSGQTFLKFNADANVTKAQIIGQKNGGTGGDLTFSTLRSSVLTEAMRIDPNGNVGIGTTTPNAKLEVSGNIFTTSNTNYLLFGTNAVVNPYVAGGSDNSIYLGTGNIARLGIDSSGNITASDLAGSGNRCVYADSTGQINVKGFDCGSASGGDNLGDHTATQAVRLNGNWLSNDGGAEGLRVDNSGNVGVGTGAPAAPLDVQAVTSSIRVLSTTGTNYAYQTFFNTSGTLYLGTENSTGGGIFTGSDAYAGVIGTTGARPLQSATNGIVRTTIDSSGNVGIGTTAPSTKLTISSTTALDGILSTNTNRNQTIFRSTGEHSWVFIDSGHSNTFLPSLMLQRLSVTYGGISLQRASSSDALGAYVESEMLAGTSGATPFSLQTNGVRRLSIDSNGNVGIGTTSPSYQLDLGNGTTVTERLALRRGSDDANQYMTLGWNSINVHRDNVAVSGAMTTFQINQIGSSGGTRTPFYIDTPGYVGIGTTSPGVQLQLGDFTQQNTMRVTGGTSSNQNPVVELFRNGIAAWQQSIDVSTGNFNIGQGSQNAYTDATLLTNTKLTIGVNGNVGIGATSPGQKLDVVGNILARTTGDPFVAVKDTDDLFSNSGWTGVFKGVDSNDATVFYVGDGASGTKNVDLYAGTGIPLRFFTNATQAMVIDTSGNVGIGATSNLNTANFQMSTGSGASSTPYMAIFNTATSPTLSASTRFDLGFLSGSSNYVATNTVLGAINFMGQANDSGYAGGVISAIVSSAGGNVARASGHAVDLTFSTKAANSASASEVMRINSAGNVGIGTASPTAGYKLDVIGNIRTTGIIAGNGGLSLYGDSSSTIPVIVSTSGALTLKGHDNQLTIQTNSASQTGGIFFQDQTTHKWEIGKNPTNNFFIYSYGSGTNPLEISYSTGAITASSLVSCGGIQTNGSGTMSCTSDETLKDKHGAFTRGLDAIRQINPESFSWKQDSGLYDNGIIYNGFIAQNVQQALPEAISISSSGKLQVSQLTLVASSINAIKELDIKVQSIPTLTDQTLYTKISEFLQGIAERGEAVVDAIRVRKVDTQELNTETLCIGPTTNRVCVTPDELRSLLQNGNTQGGSVPNGGGGETPPQEETPPTDGEEDPLPPPEDPNPQPPLEDGAN